MVADFVATFQHGDEVTVTFQPLHSGVAGSGRQGLAALGATTVDDGAAGTGAHACAEPVLHVTAAVIRLECPLHNVCSRFFQPCKSTAPHESSSTNLLSPLAIRQHDTSSGGTGRWWMWINHRSFPHAAMIPTLLQNHCNDNEMRPEVIHKLHQCYSQFSHFNTQGCG